MVIPQQLRVELGIRPGDDVEVWRDGDRVALRPAGPRTPLRGRFAGEPLTAVLEAERSTDRDSEDRPR